MSNIEQLKEKSNEEMKKLIEQRKKLDGQIEAWERVWHICYDHTNGDMSDVSVYHCLEFAEEFSRKAGWDDLVEIYRQAIRVLD